MEYIAHTKVKVERYWGSDTDLFIGVLFIDGPLVGIKGELRIEKSEEIAGIIARMDVRP